MTALATHGLTKRFAETLALDGVDLELQPGEVRGLLGPNGAGKTTLLRLLLGLVRPDAGSIELHGRGLDDPRRLEGVAGFVEEPAFYPYLTARDNLAVLAELDGIGAIGGIDAALDQVGLGTRAGDRVSGFSTGMRKRLGIAAALTRSPSLLVLDEPTAGLDPAGVRFVAVLLRTLAERGVGVLLSSHQISEVEGVCHSFTVLRAGRAVWDGTAAEMRTQAPPGVHRLHTADDARALELAAREARVRVSPGADGGLAVEAAGDALDAFVLLLGAQGVAVRRLEPAAGPLESMFFALVGEPGPEDGPDAEAEPDGAGVAA